MQADKREHMLGQWKKAVQRSLDWKQTTTTSAHHDDDDATDGIMEKEQIQEQQQEQQSGAVSDGAPSSASVAAEVSSSSSSSSNNNNNGLGLAGLEGEDAFSQFLRAKVVDSFSAWTEEWRQQEEQQKRSEQQLQGEGATLTKLTVMAAFGAVVGAVANRWMQQK